MCLHIQHMCVFVCVRATSPYLTGCAFENTLVCECVFVYALLHSGLHNELTGCGLCINQNYKYGCRTRATFPFGSLLILIYVWHHLGTGGEPPCNGWFYYLSACYMYIILFTSSFMHNYCVHSDAQIGGQSPTVGRMFVQPFTELQVTLRRQSQDVMHNPWLTTEYGAAAFPTVDIRGNTLA